MSLTLQIPVEIESAVLEMAKRIGSTPEQILIEALKSHFPPISPELSAEFDAWEAASDEDVTHLDQ